MNVDLFTGWLARCLADFIKDHGPEEHEPLEWLGLLFAEASGLPDPVVTQCPPKLLMVTATTGRPLRAPEDEDWGVEGVALGVRFCYPEDVARVEKLLVEQVRSRFPALSDLKPKQVRQRLTFTVWEVPNPPKRGGWPKWLGPTGYYY